MSIKLRQVLKNVNIKDRKIIQEEIEKIKKNLLAKITYRNYNRAVKYNE